MEKFIKIIEDVRLYQTFAVLFISFMLFHIVKALLS